MKKNKAFTLLELSSVIIIIGVLAVGTMQGVAIIKTSRIANARSITSQSPVYDIKDLVAWYETSLKNSLITNQTLDASQITTWYDISPSSVPSQRNTLTRIASSAVTYNISGINKLPSIEFDGSGNMTLGNFYGGTSKQSTIFLVFRPLSYADLAAGAKILLDSASANSTASVGIKLAAINLNAGSSVDTGTGTNPASFASGNFYIVAAYLNGASSAAYVNNATTSAGAANISAGTNQLAGLTIGSNKSSGSYFKGSISEIIVFGRPLKSQERVDVMSYLSKKYKIAVTGI